MRLIDADALMDTLRKDFTEEENDHQFIAEEWWWAATVRKTIENAPTVDVVKVIRCKDCKHYDTKDCADGFGWCNRNGTGRGSTDDWFCADGERKEKNDE